MRGIAMTWLLATRKERCTVRCGSVQCVLEPGHQNWHHARIWPATNRLAIAWEDGFGPTEVSNVQDSKAK